MDGSQYVPSQMNMITLTDPDAYFNDVRPIFLIIVEYTRQQFFAF